MPEATEKYLFQPSAMTVAPDGTGVFVLLSGKQTILIDWSSIDLRAKIREHHAGKHGTCSQIATHFRYEAHDDPEARCKQLLDEHEAEFGYKPRCNK